MQDAEDERSLVSPISLEGYFSAASIHNERWLVDVVGTSSGRGDAVREGENDVEEIKARGRRMRRRRWRQRVGRACRESIKGSRGSH